MSLQDESFPDDEFLDELEFSLTSGNHRYQFPKNRSLEHKPVANGSSNTSSSSTDQNLSSESSSDRPASDLSGKTSKSDPTGLTDATSMNGKNQGITTSYMDIHSAYTKRRFKHVESKVGQYIASMKAEDQKRKTSKFQRHRSMPETLDEHNKVDAKITMGVSATELRNRSESISDMDADISENITGSSRNHESSAETILIDKKTYAELLGEKERIQSYSDYLQTKLDEKSSEVLRLKRNVDYLRIEVGNYKDKLNKRQPTVGAAAVNSYTNAAILCGLTRQTSLHALANCQTNNNHNNNNKQTKATQTDEMITPSPQSQQRLLPCDVCVTPETPDDNNNTFPSHSTESGAVVPNLNTKTVKCVAAIQPLSLSFSNMIEQDNSHSSHKERTKNGVLRQRTNSNDRSDPQRQNNYSGRSCPSSSDSAIDIESVEANSPKLQRYFRDKVYIYDKRSNTTTRHNSLEALNTTNIDYIFNENKTLPKANERDSKTDAKKHKKNSLRWRMLRIFGPCAGCNDRNRSLDVSGLTQIPLLEKSPESICRTMR